jgi:hypothetical protein
MKKCNLADFLEINFQESILSSTDYPTGIIYLQNCISNLEKDMTGDRTNLSI